MSKNPHEKFSYIGLKINGAVFDLKDVTIKYPGIRREDIDEGNGFIPIKEGGYIKGKAYLQAGQSVKSINKYDNATVVATDNLDNTSTLSNAWVKNNPEISKDGFDIEIGVSYGDAEEKVGG